MNRTQLDPRRIAGFAFAAAIVLAPFLAAIYGWNAGLAVMVLALAATSFIAFDAMRAAEPDIQARLKRFLAVNAALCAIGAVVLVARLVSD
jgi:hypothetical protein